METEDVKRIYSRAQSCYIIPMRPLLLHADTRDTRPSPSGNRHCHPFIFGASP